MYKNFYFCYLFILTNLLSCVAQKKEDQMGTLKGIIGIYEGNCMPGPGIPPCEPRPISTTVYITQLSQNFEMKLMMDSVVSGTNGLYTIDLAPGTYSLFLKDENSVVCDYIECPEQCYCQPFEIKSDSITVIDANLDHATW